MNCLYPEHIFFEEEVWGFTGETSEEKGGLYSSETGKEWFTLFEAKSFAYTGELDEQLEQ